MAFTGNLNAVALSDIVQLVGLAQKSGTLTVVTGRGRFTVLFRNGYVVDASATGFARAAAPGREHKGELHLRANLTGDPSKGMSLEAMAGKIFRLSAGYFNFHAGEPQTDSTTALDVSGLLLESFRQHDEAVRDGTQATNDYESLPGEEGEIGLTGPGAKEVAESEKPGPLIHLYNIFRTISDEASETELESALLEGAREVFDRAILFRVEKDELLGISGYNLNEGIYADRLTGEFARLRIPRQSDSALMDVVEARHIGIGEASEEWWRDFIPPEFGPRPEMDYVALPVVAGRSCVLALYGDTYTRREFADPLRALEILCKHVGALIESRSLRAQSQPARKSWRKRLFGVRKGSVLTPPQERSKK